MEGKKAGYVGEESFDKLIAIVRAETDQIRKIAEQALSLNKNRVGIMSTESDIIYQLKKWQLVESNNLLTLDNESGNTYYWEGTESSGDVLIQATFIIVLENTTQLPITTQVHGYGENGVEFTAILNGDEIFSSDVCSLKAGINQLTITALFSEGIGDLTLTLPSVVE